MAKAAKSGGGKKAGKKAMTKSQFVAHLAEKSELSKKQVDALLTEIVDTITDQLKTSGKFVFPGLARITRTYVEAKKGGEKKINPLTKTEYVTKDKPAHHKVRINPIKAMKTALA
jgi:nucleoid DNA-binding protein